MVKSSFATPDEDRPVQSVLPVVPTPLNARVNLKFARNGSLSILFCQATSEVMSAELIRKNGSVLESGAVRSCVMGSVQGVPGIHSESLMKKSSTCAAAYT